MSTTTRTTALALLASLALAIPTASASQPQKLLLNPNPGCYDLPKFGFSSFTINGFGERVTSVRWGSIARQMGLESGDVIVRLNGFPLTYHGSWNDALRQAMANGGWVQLTVRDVRTGFLATRETYLGNSGYNPIVEYSYGNTYPTPVTQKFKTTPKHESHEYAGGVQQIKKIAQLFDKKDKP